MKHARLKYILPLFVICLIVAGLLIEKCNVQKTFLRETNQYLTEIEHQLDTILDSSYSDETYLSTDLDHIADLMLELKTTMANGHHFVSKTIPLPDEIHGFAPILDAIQGNLPADYGAEDFAQGFISEPERTFLEALSEEITNMKEETDITGGWYRLGALKQFAETYWLFEQTWQLDGIRTPSGTAPFDVLKAP